MKKPVKKRKNPIAIIIIIAYLCFLALCCFSFISDEFVKELKAEIKRSIVLQEGIYKKNTPTLKVKLHDGECEKLSGFTSLRSCDFSGSENYAEIAAWAKQNPQIDTVYTVPLVDGRLISSASNELDLSSADHGNVLECAVALNYLPNVTAVDLGSEFLSDTPVTPEDINTLTTSYPGVRFSYALDLAGITTDIGAESIDLSSLDSQSLSACIDKLGYMTSLKTVRLGSEGSSALTLDDAGKIADKVPRADIEYSFFLYGKEVNTADEKIDINHTPVDDNADAVISALKCMKKCRTLDMDYCGVSNERMEEIRDMFPDTEVIWRIWFGDVYSVRTDNERILASRPSVGGMLDNSVNGILKYCTKVKYLDLGHNDALTDISFVKYMPDLEVFIIAINQCITDISPLSACKKLEYLEINTTCISDISCLKELTGLHHVNIGNTHVTDISPLFGCKDMERLWIGMYTVVPAEQVEEMQRIAPNCLINTTVDDPHGDEWRWDFYDPDTFVYHYVPRYDLLRTQLGYTYSEYSYYWKDPLCGDPCPPQYVGTSPDGIIPKE